MGCRSLMYLMKTKTTERRKVTNGSGCGRLPLKCISTFVYKSNACENQLPNFKYRKKRQKYKKMTNNFENLRRVCTIVFSD
jgi:hypothetical protein